MSNSKQLNKISWDINKLCNFSCEYCFVGNTKVESNECGKYSPEHIAKSFEDTGKKWHIHMSGGEPFLYPEFVKLCSSLTEKNYISFNTNLSTSHIKEFSQKIRPERVKFINAAVHIIEREKHKNGINKFIENYHLLKNKDFIISCLYVSYPPLFERIEKDFNFFKSKDVKIVVKAFRGMFNGKRYPDSYTQPEIDLMLSCGMYGNEVKIAKGKTNFLGMPCSFGYNDFVMDISGDVRRCSTSRREYGNLFQGAFQPDNSPKPCPFPSCICAYQGIRGTNNFYTNASRVFLFYQRQLNNKQILYAIISKMKKMLFS